MVYLALESLSPQWRKFLLKLAKDLMRLWKEGLQMSTKYLRVVITLCVYVRLERQSSTIAPVAVLEEEEKPPGVVTTSMIEGDADLPEAVPTNTVTNQLEANSSNLYDSQNIINDTHYG